MFGNIGVQAASSHQRGLYYPELEMVKESLILSMMYKNYLIEQMAQIEELKD